MRYLLVALFFFASAVQGGEPWSKQEKYIGAAALTLHVADWAQTRYIARHPERFYEKNPFLGEHPTIGEVNRFFIGSAVVTYLIADWLGGDARPVFLITVSAVKFGAVHHNYQIGVKMEF